MSTENAIPEQPKDDHSVPWTVKDTWLGLSIFCLLLIGMLTIFLAWGAIAAASSSHDGHGKDMKEGQAPSGTYEHHAVADGIRAEFQVMSLESMNMKDEDGATHHIMVKLIDDGNSQQVLGAIGKIKVISPSKKEQVQSLKDYNGIMAANFTFEENGKYGVICLFKVNDEKKLFKFWYPHHG